MAVKKIIVSPFKGLKVNSGQLNKKSMRCKKIQTIHHKIQPPQKTKKLIQGSSVTP